jgi:ADP-ribose pyrophosphatase YjhB (NUDIX family)
MFVENEAAWLSDEEWQFVQANVPIPCVDIVPVRKTDQGNPEVGLILRNSPFENRKLWCHVGGRIARGETIREAILRHCHLTLQGFNFDIEADPQPQYVKQWFPSKISPGGIGPLYGRDPRKHAVANSFLIWTDSLPTATPGGEALDFQWFSMNILPPERETWPGTADLIVALLRR